MTGLFHRDSEWVSWDNTRDLFHAIGYYDVDYNTNVKSITVTIDGEGYGLLFTYGHEKENTLHSGNFYTMGGKKYLLPNMKNLPVVYSGSLWSLIVRILDPEYTIDRKLVPPFHSVSKTREWLRDNYSNKLEEILRERSYPDIQIL
jgi:hypothetical protein